MEFRVKLTCFQSLFPSVEVHRSHNCVIRLLDMDIQGLALVDECTTICGHVQYYFLLYFPDSLVDFLDGIGNARNVLDRAKVGNDLVFHNIIPQAEIGEVIYEMLVDNKELATQDSASVYV